MSCSNCFNGCAEIVSDKCVKYTGTDVSQLGIVNGDTLLHVENKITEKIVSIMTGAGIIPTIDADDVCPLVKSFLPCCDATTITLNDVLTALIKSICALDSRLIIVEGKLTALNSDYTLPTNCLTGVTASSDTHEMLQATINKVCTVANDLVVLANEVHTKYVPYSQLDALIKQYLAVNPPPPPVNNNSLLVPYIAYPIYDPNILNFFSAGGIGNAGTIWEKVYICNGSNGTPDLRGRTIVGMTNMPATLPLDAAVDPFNITVSPPNPAYTTLGGKSGTNQVSLNNPNQIPQHTHIATITITDPGHKHTVQGGGSENGEDAPYFMMTFFPNSVKEIGTWSGVAPNVRATQTGLIGDQIPPNPGQNVTVVNAPVGQTPSAGHANVQPVLAMNWIMYIP